MDFTYKGYSELIEKLIKNGYNIANYDNWNQFSKCAILRHDVDNSIDKAVILGQLEESLGIASTYFVLLTSDFYNAMSSQNISGIKKLIKSGHSIGLHFDETCYSYRDYGELVKHIMSEIKILSDIIGTEVHSISMHRPSKNLLDSDISIPGIVNSYSKLFFRDFKYVSDSRMRWREPVEDIIDSNKYNYLHILTHAFWYSDEKIDIHSTIMNSISNAKYDCFLCFQNNISNIDEIVAISEIEKL